MAHFFVVVGGSKIHERMAHFFIDIYKMDKQLIQYGSKLKKSELQEALLQLLFDGPEWQHDRFIEENIWGLVAALRGRPSLCFNVEIYQWISACL